MKPLDVEPTGEIEDPEIVVHGSLDPIGSREEAPRTALSLSPKSSRSAKSSRKHKNKKRSEKQSSHLSPSSAASNRSPQKSPRLLDINSDVSREPPESVNRENLSDAREERAILPSPKGVEPPAQDSIVLPSLEKHVNDFEKPAAETEKLRVPHEFKKARSVKSSRSAAGSRRSSSRRRKAIAVEVPSGASSALHGVFSGHLMKWRFEAEEGGPFVRVPAFFGATALIATTTYALIFDPNTWTILSIILSLFIYAIALLSMILEGRFMCSNPLGIRAHLRSALTRRNRVFRFVWGRGILYIIAGILSCGLLLLPSVIAGVFMATIGLAAVVTGSYSSRMFYSLRDSLKDDEFLANAFNRFDYDKDGFITLPEFVNLLGALGMDLDDRIGIKAFHAADTNHEYKISAESFQTWWKASFLKNGKAPKFDDDNSSYIGSDEEEGSYKRMA